jgi:hypothetical protein
MATVKKPTLPAALDLKAIVPARDFDLSKRFYRAVGFQEDWTNGEIALFKNGATSFLLRVEDDPGWATSLQLQIVVDSADDWYEYIRPALERFGLVADPPVNRPWGARDFVLTDPCGVRWRFTEESPP